MSRSTVYLKPPPLNCTLTGFKRCSARRNYKINQQASWHPTFLLICIVSDNHVFAWCFYINAFLTFIANSTTEKKRTKKGEDLKEQTIEHLVISPLPSLFTCTQAFFIQTASSTIYNYKPSPSMIFKLNNITWKARTMLA